MTDSSLYLPYSCFRDIGVIDVLCTEPTALMLMCFLSVEFEDIIVNTVVSLILIPTLPLSLKYLPISSFL